ncbi:hypothetical protein BDR03DRAFT_952065 [Suillus americanus]|nr:hypothetical protein BDR03DRAFT_952065 [Suillus americanus]
MAGMAAVSNLRMFPSGGYRYPNHADLLVLFRIILLSLYRVGSATNGNRDPPAGQFTVGGGLVGGSHRDSKPTHRGTLSFRTD